MKYFTVQHRVVCDNYLYTYESFQQQNTISPIFLSCYFRGNTWRLSYTDQIVYVICGYNL